MRNRSDWCQLTSIPLSLFMVVLVIGATAYAQTATNDPHGSRCSNRTLFGSYGYLAQGQVLPAPGLAFPFTSTGRVNFDGNGILSWVEHTVIGGVQQGSDWTPANGTYTVNSDCTGTMVVVTPNSPVPLQLFISVVQQGKQFYSVVNGNAITAAWARLN